MINPAAQLVKQKCRKCGADAQILVLPLCDSCLALAKTLHTNTWDELSLWMNTPLESK